MLATVQETTTTAVPRITGDPLPPWLVVLAGVLVLVAIVAGGLWARQRSHRSRDQA